MIKVYRAIKTNSLTQDFSENKACIKLDDKGNPIRPFKMEVCGLNSKSLYQALGMKGHDGRDWRCWSGELVYFPCQFEGWLKHESDLDGGIGVDIVSNGQILRDETGNLQYIKWRAWHGKQVIGQDKQQVRMGDMVMLADSTGASGGNHLHESLKWCDINGKAIKTNNGYYGAISPEFYDFENTFVGDVIEVKKKEMTIKELINKLLVNLQVYLRDIFK